MDEYCAVDKCDIRNYSINNNQNELSSRMGIMTGNIMLAEINVNRENITGFDYLFGAQLRKKS